MRDTAAAGARHASRTNWIPSTRASAARRYLGAALALVLGACIPDLGSRMQQDAGDPAASDDTGNDVAGDDGPAPGKDGVAPTDGPPPDQGTGGPLCDGSPPSQTVDVYVWAENFTFFFTPAGTNIKTLYVPANAKVNFSLATSASEEAHIFKIVIPDCQTGPVGMGGQGSETHYTWKSPKIAATYKAGGACDNHTGMDFDIVVSP